MRSSVIERKTNETNVSVSLNLDGQGKYDVNTGCGFLDHMLELFSRHGRFDLKIKCMGDTNVDYHHSVEDIGIVLGKCFLEALEDKKGIKRYGNASIPMDEALVITTLDISGRAYLVFNAEMPTEKVGDFDTELVKEFFIAFARESKVTLHINAIYGENTHHIIEGIFKSFGRAMKEAVKIDQELNGEIPSTKGII
ncbi:MAG: imidazoleglycerol-phosphate dehydratase HisB [Peptostreptococcaceae bacterium]|nr:imidazoleglycerol-phosphate dehydratase HisB [Peptostreptococcaceae bacterium]